MGLGSVRIMYEYHGGFTFTFFHNITYSLPPTSTCCAILFAALFYSLMKEIENATGKRLGHDTCEGSDCYY